MRRLWLIGLLAATGCRSTNASAPINVVFALSAAAWSVSHGGCAATCTAGTHCNARNGLCELPCDGQCAPSETCSSDDICVQISVFTTTVSR